MWLRPVTHAGHLQSGQTACRTVARLGLGGIDPAGRVRLGAFHSLASTDIFFIREVNRFKVMTAADLRGGSLAELPPAFQPGWTTKPITIAIPEPMPK